uniref:Putative secreted peptide n=1 Tax=Anopheles braziliensis TaxID=58242 RepID=A0A2M3ZPR4_9DIPT
MVGLQRPPFLLLLPAADAVLVDLPLTLASPDYSRSICLLPSDVDQAAAVNQSAPRSVPVHSAGRRAA